MQQDAATTARNSRREQFIIWFEAMRLRSAMQKMKLDAITDHEWHLYDHAFIGYK